LDDQLAQIEKHSDSVKMFKATWEIFKSPFQPVMLHDDDGKFILDTARQHGKPGKKKFKNLFWLAKVAWVLVHSMVASSLSTRKEI